MNNVDWQKWFEGDWEFREEKLYPKHFGVRNGCIYVLDVGIFASQFKQTTCDPRWLTHGVLEFKPSHKSASWVYGSSGLSNAWEADEPNPSSESRQGCEFVLQTNVQAKWAIFHLKRMVAFQLLLNADRFPGKPPLGIGDRIPLGSVIDGKSSVLTWLLVATSKDFGGMQEIPSGHFQFLEFIGITEEEAQFARKNGQDQLYALLEQNGAAPITDAARRSVL